MCRQTVVVTKTSTCPPAAVFAPPRWKAHKPFGFSQLPHPSSRRQNIQTGQNHSPKIQSKYYFVEYNTQSFLHNAKENTDDEWQQLWQPTVWFLSYSYDLTWHHPNLSHTRRSSNSVQFSTDDTRPLQVRSLVDQNDPVTIGDQRPWRKWTPIVSRNRKSPAVDTTDSEESVLSVICLCRV